MDGRASASFFQDLEIAAVQRMVALRLVEPGDALAVPRGRRDGTSFASVSAFSSAATACFGWPAALDASATVRYA